MCFIIIIIKIIVISIVIIDISAVNIQLCIMLNSGLWASNAYDTNYDSANKLG